MKILFIALLLTIKVLLPKSQPQQPNTSIPQCQKTSALQHHNTSTPCYLIDTIPDVQSLHASIDSFYTLQTQSQLLEFQTSKKGEWLKFLPNLGITYTIDGQPRPSVSISSGIFYQAKKAKQIRAAKRQSILQTTQLAAQKTKAELAQQILRYELLKEEIEWKKESHQVEREIFLIKQEEFNRLERSPADYLQAKRTYLLQQQSLREKERQLKIMEIEILVTAHRLITSNSK